MKNEERVRPLIALELRSDGTVAACLPNFCVLRLPDEQCQAIQQMMRPYLTVDEIAGFIQPRQLTLLDDERQAS